MSRGVSHLSVEVHGRVSLELVPGQISVVGGGDVVAGQRVVHVVLLLLLRHPAAGDLLDLLLHLHAAAPAVAVAAAAAAAFPAHRLPRPSALLGFNDGGVGRVHEVAREALETQLALRSQHRIGLMQL